MDDLQAVWHDHRGAVFPAALAGATIGAVELVTLDADIAGCLEAYFGSRGRLDDVRRSVLETQAMVLNDIVPHIPEPGRPYFDRLLHLALGVLRALERGSAGDG